MNDYGKGICFVFVGMGSVSPSPTVGANVPVKNPKSGGTGLESQEHEVKLGLLEQWRQKVGFVLSMKNMRPWGLIYTRGWTYLKRYLILDSI